MKKVCLLLLLFCCANGFLFAAADNGKIPKSFSVDKLFSFMAKKKQQQNSLRSKSDSAIRISPRGETVYSQDRHWCVSLSGTTLVIMYFEKGIDFYGPMLTHKVEGVGEGRPAVLQLEQGQEDGVEMLYVIVDSLCCYQISKQKLLAIMKTQAQGTLLPTPSHKKHPVQPYVWEDCIYLDQDLRWSISIGHGHLFVFFAADASGMNSHLLKKIQLPADTKPGDLVLVRRCNAVGLEVLELYKDQDLWISFSWDELEEELRKRVV
ncbi:hypothetical protein K2W90_05265 [Candidatus Babeliales bacterium]|nr:hypothetical protein [Candidatus Babeliales bacterium]